MSRMLAQTLLFVTLVSPLAAQFTPDSAADELRERASAARVETPAGPATYTAGDGTVIPIQRQWSVEQSPTAFANTPLESQPWRFDQRVPIRIHKENRTGHRPLYYFKDVRWRQEDRPEGAKFGRRAYFTTVVVDLEKLKNAYFLMKPFAPKFLAGHAAIYVEMDTGGIKTLDGETADGFVVSYEAYMRVTQDYQLIGGQLGKFRVVFVVSPWRDFLMRSIQFNKSVVKRWKLNLTAEELDALAIAIGRELSADHLERYNTLTMSCVTAALDIIDKSVHPKRRVKKSWLHGLIQNPGYALPVLADNALRTKGLITGDMETFDTMPPENMPPENMPPENTPPENTMPRGK